MLSEVDLLFYEKSVKKMGYKAIAGIDEAGRGPLAGPVVAAALIAPDDLILEGVTDSKKLSEKKRKELFNLLTTHPDIIYGIGIIDAMRIDEINILQATFEAMQLACQNLAVNPDYLLIDGNQMPDIAIPMMGIIKGDSKSHTIGAASIIAKYTRDELMLEYHVKYPQYCFDKHKGYGTKLHKEMLERYGSCEIHRQSFAPIKKILDLKASPYQISS